MIAPPTPYSWFRRSRFMWTNRHIKTLPGCPFVVIILQLYGPTVDSAPALSCRELTGDYGHCGRRGEWLGGVRHKHHQSSKIPVATAGNLHRRTRRMTEH